MKDKNIFNYNKNLKNNKKRDLVDTINDKLIQLADENDTIYKHTEYDMDFGSVLVKVVMGCN
jgi:hypothetical protein